MKSYIDAFYEILHKNSVKRRRMFSLVLVLSLFVSTGVLWELHDTVITMVNEPVCGLTEHTHTDECYEDILVCGLEENEEHTHGPECYQRVLTCGMEPHIHTASCFTDEDIPEYDPDDYESNVFSLDMPDESVDIENAPELKLGSVMRNSLDDAGDEYDPQPIETIDNIARGIKFTLFDYHEDGDTLEAAQNNYDITWDGSNWVHNSIKYDGVNSGKNPWQDIMFFAYGTPSFTGTLNDEDDNYIDDYGNSVELDYNVYKRTEPDMNNYSGDYNTNSTYPAQKSGNRPVQGIVNRTLDANGFPTISSSGHSLDYLFSDVSSNYKTVYTGVNHFLKEVPADVEGHIPHLIYDSNENYAYFNKDTRNFTIYNGTYHIINNDHHLAGDYNNLTEETYQTSNGYNMKIGFFPFDAYNTQRRDPNFNGHGFNHHFGLKMEAEFRNSSDSDDPIIFRYSGDDDMWVFIDGVLVLDIGGIHEPAEGVIDFTSGFVVVQDNDPNSPYGNETKADIIKNLPGGVNFNRSALPKSWDDDNNRWIVKQLSSFFEGIDGKSCAANDGKAHTIQVFYLERGGCYSNLSIDMNLPTIKPLSVTKQVDYQDHYSDDYNNAEYSFTVYEEDENGNVTVADLGAENNPFTLKNGERRDFYSINANKKYYVVENNVDTEIYSQVKINNTDFVYETPGEAFSVSSGNAVDPDDLDTYNFVNTVREEKTTINVSKSWKESSGLIGDGSGHGAIYFKLYQTDSSGNTKQVEINGATTFVLNSENNWTWTPKDADNEPILLPVRYGSHVYSYSVKELNVPEGYEVAYTDNDNNFTIRNIHSNSAELWLKKQWINALGDDKKPVSLILKRKKVSSTVTPTSLTINLRDPGGNLLANYYTADGVYVGGSAEFSLDVPGNVSYWYWDADYGGKYYKLSEGIELRELGNRRFEISELQAGGNTVDIKIITDNADDSLLLLHHSFTNNLDGWEANGNVEVLTSGTDAYAKGDALLIKNKSQDYEGARLKLDPLKFKAGKTYTFCAGVYFDNRNDYTTNEQESNPEYVTFKMTFYDGLGNFKYITSFRVQNGSYNDKQWAPLTGTVTLPDEINPYGMYIIIETVENEVVPRSFRIDEFVAIEGSKNIYVENGTGVVSVSLKPYYDDPFGDNDYNGWGPYGNVTLSTNNHLGDYYILVQNRQDVSNGIMKNVPQLIPGKTYRFHAALSGDREGERHLFAMSINKINPDPNPENNYTMYKNIAVANDWVTGYGWVTFDTLYTIPSEADRDNMYVYFESPQGSNDTTDFRVWNFSVTDADDFTQRKPGYTLNDGVYTSNYELYNIILDPYSVTSPRFYSNNYVDDVNFSKTITLSDANNWVEHFTKASLTGENDREMEGFMYLYYVDSETVAGATENEDYIMLPVENNYVAANDEATPILVKNKNIKFRLPATGGRGTGGIYLVGTVLIITGLLSGCAVYRQKRGRKNMPS